MKTLKQYIENHIENPTNESLFDGDEISGSERDKRVIETWINKNYTITGKLKINKDLIVNCPGSIKVKNYNITSLTNGLFRFGKVYTFDCSGCEKLESLEGAPIEVKSIFRCSWCDALESLEGAPKVVGSGFNCSYCDNIKTLEGAPEEVGRNFYCDSCKNLRSLKGGPKYVKNDFYCYGCPNLVITDSDREKYNIRS